ncbi:hypothetical protein D3C85_952740 [compost metagenome]
MPAPLQHIHGQDRSIGHLHKENLLARNVRDRPGIALERQGVKAVQQDTKARVVSLAHNVPDLLVAVHMTAPGQCFVADSQTSCSSALGQLAQVIYQNLFIAKAVERNIAAHQHQIGTQLLHQVELALGAFQVA